MGKIYEGDIGVRFVLDTKQSLTDASVLEILAQDPLGVATTWTGTATESTKIEYVNTTPFTAGDWFLQAYVEWGSGSKHLGETFKLTVHERYEYP